MGLQVHEPGSQEQPLLLGAKKIAAAPKRTKKPRIFMVRLG